MENIHRGPKWSIFIRRGMFGIVDGSFNTIYPLNYEEESSFFWYIKELSKRNLESGYSWRIHRGPKVVNFHWKKDALQTGGFF